MCIFLFLISKINLKIDIFGFSINDCVTKLKRAVEELDKLGYLNNPTEEKDFMIWWQNANWGFMAAVDPVDSYVSCINKSERINPNSPSVVFQTALPMKKTCPWTKHPEDIKIIINECKELFDVIEITD